jgi:hypothetical protein
VNRKEENRAVNAYGITIDSLPEFIVELDSKITTLCSVLTVLTLTTSVTHFALDEPILFNDLLRNN